MKFLKNLGDVFRALPLLLTVVLSACQVEREDAEVWVFVQLNVPEENDEISSLWYYGSISERSYERVISNKSITGFFTLSKVHYWNDDDVIEYYEDEQYTGELSFRIEHLTEITKMKAALDPGFSYAQETVDTSDNSL